VTDAELRGWAERCGWQARTVAREAGIPYGGQLRRRLARMRGIVASVTVERPPSADLPIGDLIAERKRRFEQKREHEEASKLITVHLPENGPAGLLILGDPHLDDDGTDLGLLEQHMEIVRRTPGLYAATVGDVTNNWVGRLAKLWAEQSTSARDSRRLTKWFLEELAGKWAFIVGGNHDAWSGVDDPLEWIAGQVNALYQSSEVRAALTFAGREFLVNCRHDHKGHSMWNSAHGPAKALQLGIRDHVAAAGHLHIGGYNIVKDPEEGRVCHAIRVPSYKVYDRYAKTNGFRDQAWGPACLLVIDPRLPETNADMIKPFWDPEEGAAFLSWKRSRRAA
jgi:hypothetical protein